MILSMACFYCFAIIYYNIPLWKLEFLFISFASSPNLLLSSVLKTQTMNTLNYFIFIYHKWPPCINCKRALIITAQAYYYLHYVVCSMWGEYTICCLSDAYHVVGVAVVLLLLPPLPRQMLNRTVSQSVVSPELWISISVGDWPCKGADTHSLTNLIKCW